jgi:predicted enzyme related to lactoylglutathione lyase
MIANFEYSSKVNELGGKIVVPKTAVPGIDYYAVCLDIENNSFGIFESDQTAK